MEPADRERRRSPVEISAASASGAAATPGARTRAGVGWGSDSLGRTDSRPQSSARRRSRQKAGTSYGNRSTTAGFRKVRPSPSPLDDQPPRVRGQGNDEGLRSLRLGTGRWPAAQPGGVEIEVARQPNRCVVSSGLRRWNCRNCGRSNKTALALDGTVTCEYCTEVGGLEALRPWKVRLNGYAGRLVALMTGEPRGAERRPAARSR